jgi:hypothetical protein
MSPSNLIELHKILSLMVKEGKLLSTEKNSILIKAGLFHIKESQWKDEEGSIYTLK